MNLTNPREHIDNIDILHKEYFVVPKDPRPKLPNRRISTQSVFRLI